MASPLDQIVTMATISRPPAYTGFLKVFQFNPLAADGSNFLEWANDANIVLGAEELTVYLNKKTAEGQPDVLKCQTLLIDLTKAYRSIPETTVHPSRSPH